MPLNNVLDRLPRLLPGWSAALSGDPALYDDGAHGRIAVRASGTEPGTRLYIEAPAQTAERLAEALGGPKINLPA
ncbi:hypothetical protein [Streptomyces graminilatus]|uniref:hypothetical protein n=1 Tax=Streptomyces graminilatus TaxID=1464070 RepID=UPI0006E35392|nr:hypothetical protein [Streptomyces graminilatus]